MRIGFDFPKFCEDNSIEMYTEGYKQCQPGWIQVECPFCTGGEGPHLGWNEEDDYLNCWRCGWHPNYEFVMVSLSCLRSEAFEVLKEYKGHSKPDIEKVSLYSKEVVFPYGTDKLQKKHKDYLEGRNFDSDKLEVMWGLKGTGHIGSYKFRILAPITFNSRLVSFQTRDITNKSKLPHKACSKPKQVRHYKQCLYGMDEMTGGDAVIVEGMADVWRLGYGSVGTCGTGYTQTQVMLLGEYRRKFIIFDAEEAAVKRAEKLAYALSAFEGEVKMVDIGHGDPADMKQKEADNLMKELIG